MTSYAQWFRERRRAAKAREEEANPSLANRRDAARRKYHRRKQRLTEQTVMQAAFLQALRARAWPPNTRHRLSSGLASETLHRGENALR